jgi:hypothetical protein
MPFIEFIGRVKFPTASRSAGLGTGEFDVGFETEFSWALRRFTPFVNVGYRYLGSPPGFELNNVVVSSVGGLYRVIDPLKSGCRSTTVNRRRLRRVNGSSSFRLQPGR